MGDVRESPHGSDVTCMTRVISAKVSPFVWSPEPFILASYVLQNFSRLFIISIFSSRFALRTKEACRMGALLSLPFLAIPSVGTVSHNSGH